MLNTGYGLLGWTERKKRSPIDSGILWADIDIYRRLSVERNRGPYLKNFWAQWPLRPEHKVKNQWPQNAQEMKFYYECHM